MEEEMRKCKRNALQLPNYMEETDLSFQPVCSKNQNYEPVYDEMTSDESVFQPAYEKKIFNKSAIQPVFDDGDEVDGQNLLGEVDEIFRAYDVNEIDFTDHPTITASESINNVERENLGVIEDDSESKNDEVPMDNVVIEKDDRPADCWKKSTFYTWN